MLSLSCALLACLQDKDISCGSWSRDGLCDTDEVVKDLCPHSCGSCPIICRDVEEACPDWAKQGQCADNPHFMRRACMFSCAIHAAEAVVAK